MDQTGTSEKPKRKRPPRTEAQKESRRIWQEANRDKVKAYNLKSSRKRRNEISEREAARNAADPTRRLKKQCARFGITLEVYMAKFVAQNGGCAICGTTPEQQGRHLAIDHDHHTGYVRGLLCSVCNVLLHKDATVESLRATVEYLKSPTALEMDA